MNSAGRRIGSWMMIAGVLLGPALAPSAWAEPKHEHEHGHTPVPEPESYRHAIRLLREYQAEIRDLLGEQDIHKAHDPAFAVGIVAGKLGRLASGQGSEVAKDRVRSVARLGTDLNKAADALHAAADEGKRPLANAKFEELSKKIDELASVLPERWVCEMACEPGKVFAKGGSCPVCKMKLEHWEDIAYSAVVTPNDGVQPGAKTPFELHLLNPAGGPVVGVSSEGVTLVMVDRSLGWVQREHAELEAGGIVKMAGEFPGAGPATIFAEFSPAGGDPVQGCAAGLVVAGPASAAPALTPDLDSVISLDGYEFRIRSGGTEAFVPVAGEECAIRVGVDHAGKPVTDLETTHGALGELLAINQARSVLVRGRVLDSDGEGGSLAAKAAAMSDAKPTDLHFGIRFPEAGLYRLFVIVKHSGREFVVPFVAEVRVPAGGGKPGQAPVPGPR